MTIKHQSLSLLSFNQDFFIFLAGSSIGSPEVAASVEVRFDPSLLDHLVDEPFAPFKVRSVGHIVVGGVKVHLQSLLESVSLRIVMDHAVVLGAKELGYSPHQL